MAAELLGGSLLSALFQALFEKMASSEVVNYFRKKKLNKDLLENLQILLVSADKVLDDAEEKQLRDPAVRKWLDELKEATYDAEDLIDSICAEILRRKIKHVSASRTREVIYLTKSLFTSTFEKAIEPKMEKILARLKAVLDQKDVFRFKEGVESRYLSQRLPATSLVEESSVYGRDAEKREIVELLLSDDVSGDRISVLPIVGMGGIGKTTLAGLVFNDDRVNKHFDVKAWVNVSDEFDICRITKTILDHVVASQASDIKDLNQLQVTLKRSLRGKKFFFVLDDVWNKNYGLWDVLRSAFESGAHGSKIVVTTRDEGIALTMSNDLPHHLRTMSHEDCWHLFAKHAFNSVASNADPNLEIIGRKIVEKCKGLPLAVKSLAGLLRSRSNPEEWNKILDSDIWKLPTEDNILPALWLSYYHLPRHLKRCFAYCSIFPVDFKFGKEELILLWMAEGFLPHQRGKRPEEIGEDYFNQLVSSSLFQKCTNEFPFINLDFFPMHDLVSELAKFVSGDFYLRLGDGDSNASTSKARHLSHVKENKIDFNELEVLPKLKSLRTFLALPRVDGNLRHHFISPLSFLPNKTVLKMLFSTSQSLRVLSLSQYPETDLPDSIGNLKHLRYLDLSSSKLTRLPRTVCNLHNLQILLLSCCQNLSQLFNKIGSLINLYHLDVTGTPLKDMPQDLSNLENLQFLSDFVVGANDASSIKQLQELRHLHGRFRISGLENIVGVGDISGTILKDLKCVNELILSWKGKVDNNDSELQGALLDKLQPHTVLKRLVIECYSGTRFADWLGDSSFSNVTSICLEDCKHCLSLPPLGQLPSLQELEISGFDALESIGDEFFSTGTCSTTEPFRSLEKLCFKDMRNWKDWSCTTVDGETGVFPSLTNLEIRGCQELVTLLSTPAQQQTQTPFPSLEHVSILYCSKLETFLEWGSFSKLQSIDIRCCEKLFTLRMNWDLQRFTSLASLDLWQCYNDVVDSFPEEGLLPTTLTSLSIFSFLKLKALNGKSFEQLTSLEHLEIGSCYQLQCLPEEGLPASLSYLYINDCPLLSGRCQRDKGEDWDKISHISHVEIDSVRGGEERVQHSPEEERSTQPRPVPLRITKDSRLRQLQRPQRSKVLLRLSLGHAKEGLPRRQRSFQ